MHDYDDIDNIKKIKIIIWILQVRWTFVKVLVVLTKSISDHKNNVNSIPINCCNIIQ